MLRAHYPLRGLTAQAIQHAAILAIVDVSAKVAPPQLKEDRRSKQAVAPSLVHRPAALHTHVGGKLVQPTLQAIDVRHEVLHVVDARKPRPQLPEELVLLLRQWNTRQQLQQVPKVVAAVKRQPLDVRVEHQARRHKQLSKVRVVDAVPCQTVEVNT